VHQAAVPANFNDLVAVKEVVPLHVHIERALAELRDTPAKPAAVPVKTEEPADEDEPPQSRQPPAAP